MKNNTISCHQLGVIAGLVLFTLKMTALPSLLYEQAGNGSMIVVATVLLVKCAFIGLVIGLKIKFKNMGLYDIIKKFLGSIIAKVLYFIFFLFFMFKLLSMVSDGYTFLKDTADEEYTLIMFFICFLPVVTALVYSGIRNIGRTAEFFFPFIVAFVVIIVVFSLIPLWQLDTNIFASIGLGRFANTVFKVSFWMGDLFTLLILLDKIDFAKKDIKKIISPFAVMAVLLFLIYLIYFILYKETSIFHSNVICDIVRYAISATVGWHMDIFGMLAYMFCAFLQGAIIMYCANDSIKKVLNFKQDTITLAFINIVIVVLEFFFLNDYLKYIYFAQNILCYFSAVTVAFVPILLLGLLIFGKKGEKNAKNTAKT
ncbi:MAG: hypothetical protein E7378_02395 [Clostridiales bacterium]|nr:hypothetical protein [Clostridiales bacterium]